MSDSQKPAVSRRAALGAIGVGAAGLAGGAGFLAASSTRGGRDSRESNVATPTVADWKRARGLRYLIAHRGSGDVYPEHSLEAYQGAAAWGAKCMEISVGMTSDGVLICMHDTTYDRTTDASGAIAEQPSTILRGTGISQPQLGPAWMTEPLPRVPLLQDVLRAFGGSVILCLEAKVDAAYPRMMAMVDRFELQRSVIVKAYRTSSRIGEAHEAGYPVFGYLGANDMTGAKISALASRLRAASDYLVIPAFHGPDRAYAGDDLVRQCVATGVPVWVYPLHRRVDVAHFFALGVHGAVCSSFGYLSGSEPVATTDTWRYKAIAPGEMTKRPDDPSIAPTWSGADELTLQVHGMQQFITLGHLSPLANAEGHYRIAFEASWTTLPRDASTNLTLAFGHADDTYYEHQYGKSSGYHATMRADGTLQLYSHSAGSTSGTQLGSTVATAPAIAGAWMRFTLDVTPTAITWSRLDDRTPHAVSVRDNSFRGGYLHIGRTAADDQAALAFRRFSVT